MKSERYTESDHDWTLAPGPGILLARQVENGEPNCLEALIMPSIADGKAGIYHLHCGLAR